MRKLTAEELAEPDVTLTISPGRWDRLVPEEVKRELRPFGNGFDGAGNYVIIIPAYRWRDIESLLRRLGQ